MTFVWGGVGADEPFSGITGGGGLQAPEGLSTSRGVSRVRSSRRSKRMHSSGVLVSTVGEGRRPARGTEPSGSGGGEKDESLSCDFS